MAHRPTGTSSSRTGHGQAVPMLRTRAETSWAVPIFVNPSHVTKEMKQRPRLIAMSAPLVRREFRRDSGSRRVPYVSLAFHDAAMVVVALERPKR